MHLAPILYLISVECLCFVQTRYSYKFVAFQRSLHQWIISLLGVHFAPKRLPLRDRKSILHRPTISAKALRNLNGQSHSLEGHMGTNSSTIQTSRRSSQPTAWLPLRAPRQRLEVQRLPIDLTQQDLLHRIPELLQLQQLLLQLLPVNDLTNTAKAITT